MSFLEYLQVFFYIVFGLCITLYSILDGFDLGTGMLHLFTKKDVDRRIFLNAIGPVWDGNSVWIVLVMGVLFAGFPPVFASLFSGFYILSMLLIFGLMFRAVAIEFRSKREDRLWRNFWDHVFSYSSYLIAFGVGVILGNFIEGVPVDSQGNFLADLKTTFRIFPVLVGFLSISLFSMHGAIYLCMKTEGPLHEQLRKWVSKLVTIFACVYVLISFLTLKYMPHMTDRIVAYPFLTVIPVFAILAFLNVIRLFAKGKDFLAFGSSAAGIALLFITFSIGTFPALIRSNLDSSFSMTIFNSSSSQLTLTTLSVIVVTGVPLIFLYGSIVYKIFRGKVKLNDTSY
jgi:cytochrome bd ubiquinol oxidase subunit II